MKTEKFSVTAPIYVWAWPKDPKYEDVEGGVFHFDLRDSKSYHWRTGAICIHEMEVTIDVPAGVDLLGKAVDTIHAKIAEEQMEQDRTVRELNEQLKGLLQLTHQPEDDCIQGEVL